MNERTSDAARPSCTSTYDPSCMHQHAQRHEYVRAKDSAWRRIEFDRALSSQSIYLFIHPDIQISRHPSIYSIYLTNEQSICISSEQSNKQAHGQSRTSMSSAHMHTHGCLCGCTSIHTGSPLDGQHVAPRQTELCLSAVTPVVTTTCNVVYEYTLMFPRDVLAPTHRVAVLHVWCVCACSEACMERELESSLSSCVCINTHRSV